MATDTGNVKANENDRRELRYPNIVSCLSGKMERDAVNYQEDQLNRLRGEADMLATIFGFSTDADDWTEKKVRAHNWATSDASRGDVAWGYFWSKVKVIKLIEQRRDDLWKEIVALQADRVEFDKGAFVRAFVDCTGYQVSLYDNGAEIAYTLRDWGGSPTDDQQEQITAIIHKAVATYMGELALALRKHFDAGKPLSEFDYHYTKKE